MVLRIFVRYASTVRKPNAGRSTTRRSEIVSQALCDDIVQRLRPSLPAPKTCDLIDVNPGTGVWSQALHKVLQPRRHVLVEPYLHQYEDTLGRLLKNKSSPYRHASNLPEVLDPGLGLLSEYKTQKGGSLEGPPQFNESLLITVNFSGRMVSAGGYFGSLGKKFFDDLYLSLSSRLSHGLFRYGLIRILAWMPAEMGKEPFLPRTVFSRSKQSIMLESVTDITEVASLPAKALNTKFRRWTNLDLEEYTAINGGAPGNSKAEVSASRMDEPPPPELRSIDPDPDKLRSLSYTSDATWVQEFLRIDDLIKKKSPQFHRQIAQNPRARIRSDASELQQEWAKLRMRAASSHKTYKIAVEAVNQGRQLVADWKAAVEHAKGGPVESALEGQLRDRGHDLSTRIQSMSRTNRVWTEKALDDCRGCDMSPPILYWSRRTSHPLTIHEGEIEPSKRQMALYDVIPNANLLTRLTNTDQMACYRHVMATFSSRIATMSVADGLKLLVHKTGAESFAKTVPGLNDPTKGGWYDLAQLRLRALPADMFVEIALAFERWPFRPQTKSMLLAGRDTQESWIGEEARVR